MCTREQCDCAARMAAEHAEGAVVEVCMNYLTNSMHFHPAPPQDLNLQELDMEGVKHDGGKPRLGLIHKVFMWSLATTLTKGAQKYAEYNWLGGMDWNRPYDAMLRHLTAWWDGESKDEESGDSHLWHAAAELMFLVVYEKLGLGRDNRFKKPATYLVPKDANVDLGRLAQTSCKIENIRPIDIRQG